jgi:hypothetical protein
MATSHIIESDRAMATTARIEDPNALLKEAADLLDVAQRREDAVKLAFSLVEKGRVPPFETFASFQEKVAGLMEKDLRVVEQALELDVDMPAFGKVAGPSVPEDATAAFYHRLADD